MKTPGWTNIVEIDLLQAGDLIPVVGAQVQSNYRICVSRGIQRPRASLIACTLRQLLPPFTLPLLPGDSVATSGYAALAVVQASLAGSIIGNLLVLGATILAGGLRHSEQHFNPRSTRS